MEPYGHKIAKIDLAVRGFPIEGRANTFRGAKWSCAVDVIVEARRSRLGRCEIPQSLDWAQKKGRPDGRP